MLGGGNDPDNLVTACWPCNHRKLDFDVAPALVDPADGAWRGLTERYRALWERAGMPEKIQVERRVLLAARNLSTQATSIVRPGLYPSAKGSVCETFKEDLAARHRPRTVTESRVSQLMGSSRRRDRRTRWPIRWSTCWPTYERSMRHCLPHAPSLAYTTAPSGLTCSQSSTSGSTSTSPISTGAPSPLATIGPTTVVTCSCSSTRSRSTSPCSRGQASTSSWPTRTRTRWIAAGHGCRRAVAVRCRRISSPSRSLAMSRSSPTRPRA